MVTMSDTSGRVGQSRRGGDGIRTRGAGARRHAVRNLLWNTCVAQRFGTNEVLNVAQR